MNTAQATMFGLITVFCGAACGARMDGPRLDTETIPAESCGPGCWLAEDDYLKCFPAGTTVYAWIAYFPTDRCDMTVEVGANLLVVDAVDVGFWAYDWSDQTLVEAERAQDVWVARYDWWETGVSRVEVFLHATCTERAFGVQLDVPPGG